MFSFFFFTRPFMVPKSLRNHDDKGAYDGGFRKDYRPSDQNLIGLRIWVRDDFRIKYNKDDVCTKQSLRRLAHF